MKYGVSEKGYYETKLSPYSPVKYDSSWEREYMALLDFEEDGVKKWFKNGSVPLTGKQSLKIPYEFEGEMHNFIPDFIVIMEDGTRQLREVKAFSKKNGKKEFADQKAEEKIKEIKKVCAQKGYVFKLVRKFR